MASAGKRSEKFARGRGLALHDAADIGGDLLEDLACGGWIHHQIRQR